MGSPDYLKVSFFNTSIVLNPETKEKLPIPDGYTVVITMPPQTRSALSEKIVIRTTNSSQSLLMTNVIISKVFKTSM